MSRKAACVFFAQQALSMVSAREQNRCGPGKGPRLRPSIAKHEACRAYGINCIWHDIDQGLPMQHGHIQGKVKRMVRARLPASAARHRYPHAAGRSWQKAAEPCHAAEAAGCTD